MLKRLLILAQKLDNAGLTKEADLADKIAQMDEWDDTAGDWDAFDSMDGVGKDSEVFGDEEGVGAIEVLVGQLDSMKSMVEEGMIDEDQLAEVQSQVDAMMSLFLGGGPGMLIDEAVESGGYAFGGSMELGGEGIESKKLPVAEARARRARMRIRGLK